MTVQNTSAKVREDGDGAKSVFSFSFKIFTETDIEVYTVVKSTGVQTLKVLNTDYTVSINQITEGGTITYLTTVPSALEEFFAKRVVPDTQTTDIPNVGSIREEQIENPLDKRTMVSQQQQEQLNRAVLLSETTTASGPITLPDPEEGKGLYWSGGNLANTTDDLNDIVTDAQAAQAAAEAAQAAAEAAQTAAETAETNAANSASAAATSASNAATSETNAATSASNASTSASNAATSESNAATSESNAATSEANAAASAARLRDTSSTALTPGLGSTVWTTDGSGKFFDPGTFILAYSISNPTDYMSGQVTGYSGSTLTVNVTDFAGVTSRSDWQIVVSGAPGQDGASGTDFSSLSDTPSNYVGASLFKVRVNAGETGLEFVADTATGGGGLVFSTALMGG